MCYNFNDLFDVMLVKWRLQKIINILFNLLNIPIGPVLDKTVKETNNYTTEELIDFSHVTLLVNKWWGIFTLL